MKVGVPLKTRKGVREPMRILVASALTAALASTGCSSSRCHQNECAPAGVYCMSPAVPPQPSPPPPPPAEFEPAPPPAEAQLAPPPVPAPVVSKVSAPEPVDPVLEAQRRGYGQGENHVWLVGRLQRVHVPGSDWKLRYLPITQQDDYGGSVVMSLDARIDEFQDGDIVYVEGEIIGQRPTLYLSGPLYRIRTIRAVPEQNRIAAERRAIQ